MNRFSVWCRKINKAFSIAGTFLNVHEYFAYISKCVLFSVDVQFSYFLIDGFDLVKAGHQQNLFKNTEEAV